MQFLHLTIQFLYFNYSYAYNTTILYNTTQKFIPEPIPSDKTQSIYYSTRPHSLREAVSKFLISAVHYKSTTKTEMTNINMPN